MKLDSNFKIKKPIKRLLSLGNYKNLLHKNKIKKIFISAQLSEMEAERSKYSKPSTDSTVVDS